MAPDTADLKVTVETPAAWTRRLHITVPADRVERERRTETQKLAQKIRLPGFRKGKVPPSVMQKRFGPAIEQQVIERVMGEAYREAVRREGLQPITDGSIDNVRYEAGADLTFDVGFEIRPVAQLERLGGFTVRRPAASVQDGQVDQVLERLRDEQAAWRPIDEGDAVLEGDRVEIEITPIEDEGPGNPRTYEVVLGAGEALPAVEDAVRTLRPGAESEFTVELPDRAEDPASPMRPHRLRMRMVSAKRPERPALDDAFAQSLGDFGDLAKLRERIAEDLAREAEREADRAVRERLISSILEANPLEVPASMVDAYLERLVPGREGADPERLDEIRRAARPSAERAIRRMLVIDRVAETESLAASGMEVDARVAEIAGRLERPAAEVKSRLRKSGRLVEIEQEITEQKVFEYLSSLSTIENEA